LAALVKYPRMEGFVSMPKEILCPILGQEARKGPFYKHHN
jgi:hypothetical protein